MKDIVKHKIIDVPLFWPFLKVNKFIMMMLVPTAKQKGGHTNELVNAPLFINLKKNLLDI
jgi:hypothetical protein